MERAEYISSPYITSGTVHDAKECFSLQVSSLRNEGSCKRANILWQRDQSEI